MNTAEFRYLDQGRVVAFDDIFPDFDSSERLGIVVRTPGGVHRAGGLLLAAIGRFYERLLAVADDFYLYPEFFVFHVDGACGHHGWMDVWPEHKEVQVSGDPQTILNAVNDRAITRLIVESGERGTGTMVRETVESAKARIKTALTFEPSAPGDGDLAVTPSAAAAHLIAQSADASRALIGDSVADGLMASAASAQSFERVSTDDALRVLCGYGQTDGVTLGLSEAYRRAHNVDETVLIRHRLTL